MYKNSENTAKGLAVYFYPELDREIIVVGIFANQEDIWMGNKPIKYTVWDDQGRLDKYDIDEWDTFPTRDEVKFHYLELL